MVCKKKVHELQLMIDNKPIFDFIWAKTFLELLFFLRQIRSQYTHTSNVIVDNLLIAVGNAQPDIETTCSKNTIYLQLANNILLSQTLQLLAVNKQSTRSWRLYSTPLSAQDFFKAYP